MQAPSSRCPPGVHCLSLQAASLPCLTCAPAQVLAPLAEVLSGARSLPSWYIRAGGGKATQRADRAAAGLSRPQPAHAALTLRAWALRVVGQAPRGPRWTTVSLLCFFLRATGAALSAHHARSRPTTAEACPLVVHAASSTPLPRAPAGLLQRCRPGAACCWAPALRSLALLLLVGKVSVGPVGLELDLWWAEYELWPARAQRRPDSCKRRRLAAHQVCTACLFRLPRFLASLVLQPRYWLRWLRSCQALAACHLGIYVQAAERPRNAQTGPRQDFPGHNLRTRRSRCAHGPCASLARRPGGPGGQRCHSSASFCAPPALRSAPTTPAPGRRLQKLAPCCSRRQQHAPAPGPGWPAAALPPWGCLLLGAGPALARAAPAGGQSQCGPCRART